MVGYSPWDRKELDTTNFTGSQGNTLPSSTLGREERGQIFVGVEILQRTEETQRNQRGIRWEI